MTCRGPFREVDVAVSDDGSSHAAHQEDLNASLARPDLTAFACLEDLGLEDTSQRLGADRAVLACGVVDSDDWCKRCGRQGTPRDPVTKEPARARSAAPRDPVAQRGAVYRLFDFEGGRLEHLRGLALGFRNLTNYIARALLEAGGFRPRLHPEL
jgi:hypothetical protein